MGKMNFYVSFGASNGLNLPWLHSTFKELSNDTSHAQIRVKMKKLCPQQVEEEKNKLLSKNYVATKQGTELCRDELRFCHDKASDKNLSRQSKGELFHDKPKFCLDKASDKTFSQQNQILSQQSQQQN